jgi:hypothetical protein
MTNVPLIYVWIGHTLPVWANDSLELSRGLCGVETILLTNSTVEECIHVDNHYYIEDFFGDDNLFDDENLNVASKFRNGFWLKTLQRFFVLKKFMAYSGINRVFHAELDNIIFDISGLPAKLDSINYGLFCPRDSIARGIASLIYINEPSALECFDAVDIKDAGVSLNDMSFLGRMLTTSELFHSLPTENSFDIKEQHKWKFINPDSLGGIFDAASIGQYLFGIDGRNTFFPSFNGFVNENSGDNLTNLSFEIHRSERLCLVNLLNDTKNYRLFNIHVHSKIFNVIKNNEACRNIVNRVNSGKKTLIKKSFGYGN